MSTGSSRTEMMKVAKKLAGLPELRKLSISVTPLTDVGLKELAALEKLEVLDLRRCHYISSAGLAELAALTRLQS